ncbi:MAG: hypothetical protein K0S01_3085 [Herbinix sp.]|nr:hypothetical protein [Herbinix sp.]
MDFHYNIPTKVSFVNYEQTMEYLYGGKFINKHILLVMSVRMMERFGFSEIIEDLKKNNHVTHIVEAPPNPTEMDILEALNLIAVDYEIVIACGGGSVIDLAKAIIALSYKRTQVSQVIKDAIIKKEYLQHEKKVEFIAVPTTAGTGSEVTRWATVWDSSREMKMSVDAPWLAPSVAYIIPELTMKLSNRLTLSTGLDALTHAIESYWSKKSNAISRELSKSAIHLITKYLPKVLKDPDHLEYRTKMSLGSVFAGLAFANTRTTACHSISYPLTMRYGVEHGFAAAITLIPIMRLNRESIVEIDEFMNSYGGSSIDDMQEWLDEICRDIQRLRLSSFGIHKEDIKMIAEMSFTAGRMDNNPVDIQIEDIIEILNEIL